jgi:hypothetical protein
VLHAVAVVCSVTVPLRQSSARVLLDLSLCCSVLQCVAACSSTLQSAAACCIIPANCDGSRARGCCWTLLYRALLWKESDLFRRARLP